MKNPTTYELVAQTIDDACGESFDKVAKLLGLGYLEVQKSKAARG